MACQEALASGAAPVARAALTKLHALLVARAAARAPSAELEKGTGEDGLQGDKAAPVQAAAEGSEDLPEATVLRCLVKLGLDELASALQAQQPPRPTAGDGGAEGGSSGGGEAAATALRAALTRLGQWLHLASQRIGALGLAAFVGPGEAHAAEHVAWYAAAAWNAGLDAAGGPTGLRLFLVGPTTQGGSAAVQPSNLIRRHPEHPDPEQAKQFQGWGRAAGTAVLLSSNYSRQPHSARPPHTAPRHPSYYPDAREFQSATVLMNACAELLALHPDPAARHLRQQRMAFLVAGSAALEVGSQSSAVPRQGV
jgi:hypothetical protein